MTINVVLNLSLWRFIYSSFDIQGVRGYKQGNRVGYNMISIRALSQLIYFTYIFIHIIFYALGARHGLLDGGPSHSGPLLRPSESLQSGISGTNPRHFLAPLSWKPVNYIYS
jgi:hypothetical protein